MLCATEIVWTLDPTHVFILVTDLVWSLGALQEGNT